MSVRVLFPLLLLILLIKSWHLHHILTSRQTRRIQGPCRYRGKVFRKFLDDDFLSRTLVVEPVEAVEGGDEDHDGGHKHGYELPDGSGGSSLGGVVGEAGELVGGGESCVDDFCSLGG